jgi:hypothetical protein
MISKLSARSAALPWYKWIWSADARPVLRPIAFPTTKAVASASVSRTVLVVAVRRSALCNILVRQFVNERRKLLRCGLSRQNGNLPAVAHAQSGGDALFELQLDTLSDHKINQPLPVLAYAARDLFGQFGKFLAFGLAHVEHIRITEPNQHGLILSEDLLLGFFVLLAANANHGGEDADSALSLLDLAAKLVPGGQSGDAGCVWILQCDLKNVAKAVIVKPAHLR